MSFEVAHRGVATFVHNGETLRFACGEGPWLFDSRGNRWLDLVCGYGPVVLGHADAEFSSTVQRHLAHGLHFASYSTLHDEYAAGLPSIWAEGSCGFFKTSSEAVSAGLRIAAQETGKKGVVRCGFVGWHDAQQSQGVSWHLLPQSVERHIPSDKVPILRGVSGEERVFEWYDMSLASLRSILTSHADTIGSVVLDTYQLDLAGMEIARAVIDIAAEFGVLSILDETKTSGRVAELGFTQALALSPSMVIAGKAIANGAPLSLLLLPRSLGGMIAACRVGGTHAKERFGVAAAVVTRELMAKRRGYVEFQKLGAEWAEAFRKVIVALCLDRQLDVKPVLGGAGLDFRLMPEGNTALRRRSLQDALAAEGILALVGHPSFLSLSHVHVDMKWLGERIGRSLDRWSQTAVAKNG